jgi:hypothetical protein
MPQLYNSFIWNSPSNANTAVASHPRAPEPNPIAAHLYSTTSLLSTSSSPQQLRYIPLWRPTQKSLSLLLERLVAWHSLLPVLEAVVVEWWLKALDCSHHLAFEKRLLGYGNCVLLTSRLHPEVSGASIRQKERPVQLVTLMPRWKHV